MTDFDKAYADVINQRLLTDFTQALGNCLLAVTKADNKEFFNSYARLKSLSDSVLERMRDGFYHNNGCGKQCEVRESLKEAQEELDGLRDDIETAINFLSDGMYDDALIFLDSL